MNLWPQSHVTMSVERFIGARDSANLALRAAKHAEQQRPRPR
jgi:hypothetical protein